MNIHGINVESIISHITISGIVGIIGFVIGTYYKANIEKRIQHEFDRKIEEFRSSIRKKEDEIKADLRAKEDEISTLRTNVLSGLSGRQAILDKRRIDAVDKMWAASVGLSKLKALAQMTAPLDMEANLEMVERGGSDAQKIKQFAEVLWNSNDLDNAKSLGFPETERPFVSETLWLCISAYRAVLFLPIAQLAAIKTGIGKSLLADYKPIADLVTTVLPSAAALIEQFGINVTMNLIDQIELKILEQCRSDLKELTYGSEHLEITASTLKAVSLFSQATKQIDIPPEVARH